jgi:hypothetical protein
MPRTKDIEAAAAQDNSNRTATVDKPTPEESNVRQKRHPAAVLLGGLIGIYQSFTHLGGAKGRKKNRPK